MSARWLWGAKWADGTSEVELLPRYEVERRHAMATGMGGPARIIYGKVPKRLSDEQAVAAARKQLGLEPGR